MGRNGQYICTGGITSKLINDKLFSPEQQVAVDVYFQIQIQLIGIYIHHMLK
jgi:hypothetical protein